jgi:7-keto-8-aminopelargonate synthetase-like enzyme
MTDLFSKFDPLIAERQALLDTGVRDPFAIVMDAVTSPTEAMIQGRRTILLGTYNYMGMTFDPDVVAAGKKALDEFGSGTTGSRVLNGTYQGHKECEEALKDFYGTSSAMVFSTGYQANLGMISTLAGKGDYIILDADSHASIYDGCWLGNASVFATTRWRIWTRGSAVFPPMPRSSSCLKASIRCSATSRPCRKWSLRSASTPTA